MEAVTSGTDVLVTRNELARRLGVSLTTLWRWHKTGYGPPVVKIGSTQVRYKQSEVERFVDSLSGEPVG